MTSEIIFQFRRNLHLHNFSIHIQLGFDKIRLQTKKISMKKQIFKHRNDLM